MNKPYKNDVQALIKRHHLTMSLCFDERANEPVAIQWCPIAINLIVLKLVSMAFLLDEKGIVSQ